jgi:membrane associated rhomboid family serine protease
MFLPIRTETPIRRTPAANYLLLAVNVLAFLMFDLVPGGRLAQYKPDLELNSAFPHLYQFVTYQFLHGDWGHLLGNMLFLWVFGNAVNGKLGDVAYLLLYLAGGVFAGCGHAFVSEAILLGASGSIAAITTAYLVLFPRSRVTVLYFFFFIGAFQVPAMLLIAGKIIVWDNMIAPSIAGAGNVAIQAHLAGYTFGLVATTFMLLIRVLPRDQFDMLALLRRWNQRRAFRAALADPASQARAQYGRVARAIPASPAILQAESARLDRVTNLRARIGESVEAGDLEAAAAMYEELMGIDAAQCLSARHQITLARHFYATGRTPQAAAAFERYLASYGSMAESEEVRLLLGIIYARDLRQFEASERHLQGSLQRLSDPARRAQCQDWLAQVRHALGKPPLGT